MKKIISLLLAFALTLSLEGVCFAAEPTNNRVQENIERVKVLVNSENSTILPFSTDGEIAPIYAEFGYGGGTTTGYVSGSFTVPSSYSNVPVRFAWSAGPMEGDNMSAVFQLTVAGRTYYLPANNTGVVYEIGNFNPGTYYFNIVPYTNVSGEYAYGYTISTLS